MTLVLLRRFPRLFAEHLGKIQWIFKTAQGSNVFHTGKALIHESAGLLNAECGDVL